MAVYTQLDEVALQRLWSAYADDDTLLHAVGIPQGSINTTYRLQTQSDVFFLRINEGKDSSDVWYEAHLLAHLAGARLAVVTPSIKPMRSGGLFFHVEERHGRPVWAEVFPALPGGDLDALTVQRDHVAQIGEFLARAHGVLRSFRGGRANPYGAPWVDRCLAEVARCDATREVALRLGRVTAAVRAHRRLLPRGVIHGDLFIDNSKWTHGKLAAVFDWEMAGKDHLALDVAVALHAWCWRQPSAGGSGTFDGERCRALIDGYQRARRFAPSERRGLYVEALLAAVRFTASRLYDFEVPRPGRAEGARAFLDHRDFLARLDALEALGERGFLRMVGL